MPDDLLKNTVFLREIFDAIPAMLLVVDNDVRILHLNATATAGLGIDIKDVLHKRGGEALSCIHANDVPEGCGRGPVCHECVVRNSVSAAIFGNKTYRKGTRMHLKHGDKVHDLHLLITASPFRHEGKEFVLLTLENVSELIQLKSMLPICMHCKKIRNDEGYWRDIADYMSAHLDVEFTHGLCQSCANKLYPGIKKS
jgi:PAS domain-containing protein